MYFLTLLGISSGELSWLQFRAWPLPILPSSTCWEAVTVVGKMKTLNQTQSKIEHLLTATVWKKFSTSYKAWGAETILYLKLTLRLCP